MTPEEHYHDAEALIQGLDDHGGYNYRKACRADLRLRAAEVGAQLRERWGHDELAKMETLKAKELPRVAERPLDIADLAAMDAERRTARALDAVKAVTVGWAKGQYDDKLDAFDAVRAIIDGQPDGPGEPEPRGLANADVATDQLNTLLSSINGTLRELDRIVSVYAQRTSAEDLAYGRGLANAVQRIHNAMDPMDRGQ